MSFTACKTGGKNAVLPVAKMQASNGRVCSPSAVFTNTSAAFLKLAVPVITVTFLALSIVIMPAVNFWVAAFWRACTLGQEMLCVKESAGCSAPSWHKAGRRRAVSKRWAASNKDLDGMHPQLRQTPPILSFSINVTCAPKEAAFNAAGYPPGPAPITTIFLAIKNPFSPC